MRAPMMMIAVVVAVLLAVAEARYYRKINNDYVAYVDWERSKRQSHPDSTIARIPQIPWADPVNNEATPGVAQNDAVPAPVEYLTPPAPDSPLNPALQLPPQQPPPPTDKWNLTPPPSRQSSSNGWDLGFDAGDILVPPPNDQAAQYDTLRVYTLVPNSSRPEEGLGPVEQESAADSRTPFIDSYHPQWQPPAEDAAESPSNKPPVYTYVKTDPHGHFKWGVHIGH